MERREFFALHHETGEELAVSGIKGRKKFYGFVMSREFSPTTLMCFPRNEWCEVA
jgi:hypothetical protein